MIVISVEDRLEKRAKWLLIYFANYASWAIIAGIAYWDSMVGCYQEWVGVGVIIPEEDCSSGLIL